MPDEERAGVTDCISECVSTCSLGGIEASKKEVFKTWASRHATRHATRHASRQGK